MRAVRQGENNWVNRGNGPAALSVHWLSAAQVQAHSKGREGSLPSKPDGGRGAGELRLSATE